LKIGRKVFQLARGGSSQLNLLKSKLAAMLGFARHEQALVANSQNFLDAAGTIDPVRVSNGNAHSTSSARSFSPSTTAAAIVEPR
jgi:hypothetical protein